MRVAYYYCKGSGISLSHFGSGNKMMCFHEAPNVPLQLS